MTRTRTTSAAVMAALALWAAPSRAADVSTSTVSGSTSTAVSPSTATARAPVPEKKEKPEPPEPKSPPPPPDAEVSARAASALRAMAAAYNDKRRSVFMKYVSDDYTGDLSTLEDALSSDFRSYRSIVLTVTPNQTTVKGLKTQVQFRFDMTVTDDQGQNSKFAGQALYTFVDEDGKAKLLTMDRTPIFGTSLSSVENPVPKSQGTPTATGTGTTAPPGGGDCGTVISGSSVLDLDSQADFSFDTQTRGGFGTGDISMNPGNILSVGAAGLADMGPCDLNAFAQDPASINDSSDPVSMGECYAVRTNGGKYAAFKITSIQNGGSFVGFVFKYQTSGQRCF